MHGRICLRGGVTGDSVHHVAYPRRVVMCFFLHGNRCERRRRLWWGDDESGSDVAVGCLAEALFWSCSDF